MTPRDYKIALELKNRFSNHVPVVEMRVFGSRARGDNEIDSDLDVFVEVEDLNRSIRRLLKDASWEVGLDHDLVIAPVFFSREELERTPQRSTPLLQTVREEGILI
jgi:predicted nucleotidyltransferase